MASLLPIVYGDNDLCKKMIKVVFMISVDVIKHSEAHLTTKMEVKKICSLALKHCMHLGHREALYMHYRHHWKLQAVTEIL